MNKIFLLFALLMFGHIAKADACRLNSSIPAYGNGHSATCIIDKDGRLVVVEYGIYDPKDMDHNGSNAVLRRMRAMPVFVPMDDNGHITSEGMQQIVGAFGDYYGIKKVQVAYFPEADDFANAMKEINAIDNEIANGESYRLFDRNCTTISSRILTAAGAVSIGHGIKPNKVSEIEISQNSKCSSAMQKWTGVWRKNEQQIWVLENDETNPK